MSTSTLYSFLSALGCSVIYCSVYISGLFKLFALRVDGEGGDKLAQESWATFPLRMETVTWLPLR